MAETRYILRRTDTGLYYVKDHGWVGKTESVATKLTAVQLEFRQNLYYGTPFRKKTITI